MQKKKYRFYGKVTKKPGQIEMASPVFDKEGEQKNTGKIVPIYPTTKGLSETVIRQAVENALNLLGDKIEEDLQNIYVKNLT